MSYARWSALSNVYVFAHVDGFVDCCGCNLPGHDGRLNSAPEVVAHMQAHLDAGDKVPPHLLDESLYPDEDFTPYVRERT